MPLGGYLDAFIDHKRYLTETYDRIYDFDKLDQAINV